MHYLTKRNETDTLPLLFHNKKNLFVYTDKDNSVYWHSLSNTFIYVVERQAHYRIIEFNPKKDTDGNIKWNETINLQACIPVGCVPSAAVAVCWGGWPSGVYPSMHWDRHPPWTEWQTGVKTLPCRNFVADGNKRRYTEMGYNVEKGTMKAVIRKYNKPLVN